MLENIDGRAFYSPEDSHPRIQVQWKLWDGVYWTAKWAYVNYYTFQSVFENGWVGDDPRMPDNNAYVITPAGKQALEAYRAQENE